MPRKTDRDFTQAFQAGGVLDALVGPLISDNIQMTYQMGDLGELLNIVRFPRRYSGPGSAAVVGELSHVKLVPPPDGAALIFHLANQTVGVIVLVTISTIAPLTGEAVQTIGFETQGPTRSILSIGSTVAGFGTGLAMAADSELVFANQRPIILEPGNMLTITGPAANTGIGTIQLGWQEIPRAPIAS